MKGFVVDASIAIAWVHFDQATPRSGELLDALSGGARVIAPALWPLETANALLFLARRRKITESEREAAISALGDLSIEIDHEAASLAFGSLSKLAARQRLSIYDAAYLELAMRTGLPLATKDAGLRAAARRQKVKLA